MKHTLILAMFLIFLAGCSIGPQYPSSGPTTRTTPTAPGTQEIVLNEQELQQLGMTNDGTGCQTEEYPTSENSALAQYSICNYIINRLNDTQVVLELKKFTNPEDLNGTYQYESLHLRGFQGLISENDYGDFSRFYVNNESAVYYYHLWVGKNEYLIHITSKGSMEAREHIASIGQQTLSKFK